MNYLKIIFLILISSSAFSQTKNFIDLPYIETTAKVDTLIVPDKIYITIRLDETDIKNKKSTEELERELEKVLKNLNINTEENLSLLDFNSDFKTYFLKGQQVLKSKNYSLLVTDAFTAGKVLAELENVGISNVEISKTEYSKANELLLDLKMKAVKKAKLTAENLANTISQKIGNAIFISDINNLSNQLQGKIAGVQMRGASSIYGNRAMEPIYIEFQKLVFEVQVDVKFKLE